MVYEIRRLWVHKQKTAREAWQTLLLEGGVRAEESVDYTVGMYDGELLVATGSLFENILKCMVVRPEYQGGEVFSQLVSHLQSEVLFRGYASSYVYTKPQSVDSFVFLGFREIARVRDQLVFLERAVHGFGDYLTMLAHNKVEAPQISAIVMNANPFTKGHQYLVEYAAKHSGFVHVFVLSENLSVFPNEVRINLVRQGTVHLPNVAVHPTGDYMVSAKTFPSYFLKEDVDVTTIQAELDATIFLQIADVLGITRRYMGEEPLSPTTAVYNNAMQQVFGSHKELVIIPRQEHAGKVISASRVRSLLAQGKLEATRELVPPTTFAFLSSAEGQNIQKKLQQEEQHATV